MRDLLGVLLLASIGNCARILAILPVPVKSHYTVMEPLLQELAARNHQVTVYTSFPQKRPLPNFVNFDCSIGRTIYLNNFDFDSVKRFVGNEIKCLNFPVYFMPSDCENVFKESAFKQFDYKKENYDLVITQMFGGDCFVHFANVLNAPLLSIVTSDPLPWIPDNFGLPDNPAYIPSWSMHVSQMNLVDRIKNTILLMYGKVIFSLISNPSVQAIAEDYFQTHLPWVGEVAQNSSFLLINSHFTLSKSRPLTPNVAYIGGIHIKEPQPLPKDLKEIMDNSPQGVILFSFGSILSIPSMPKEKFNIILQTFSKLNQTVIMKYEGNISYLPKNVVIKRWLPQRDLLEHRNLVAFISHGGIASVIEAVHCAKPMVGIPFFSDQFLNVDNLVSKGAAVSVDFEAMTEQDFGHAVDEVLNNPRILDGMKHLSQQFRDQPMTALQTAVYWTEYVIRHKGAPHLRPASTTLSFYQLWLLDVIAVLLATMAVIAYLVFIITKCLISTIKRKFSPSNNNLKKEN